MAKVLRCMDVGVGCGFEARATTEEEVLKIAAQHAKTDHGIDKVKTRVHDGMAKAYSQRVTRAEITEENKQKRTGDKP